MPTLPTHSLFDKDLSLRSPFPHHVLAPTPRRPPVIGFVHPGSVAGSAAPIQAPRDFGQITRPTPSKAKSHSVFDLTFGPNEKPNSSKSILRPPAGSQSRISAAKDLDRMLLASPMPKALDKTYSSLGVSHPRPNIRLSRQLRLDDATGNQCVVAPETFATLDENTEPREERYSSEQSLEHPWTTRDNSSASPSSKTQIPRQTRQIPDTVESVELRKSMDRELLGKCDELLEDAGSTAVRIRKLSSHRRKRASHTKKETEQEDPPPKSRRLPRGKYYPADGKLTDSEPGPKRIPSPSSASIVITKPLKESRSVPSLLSSRRKPNRPKADRVSAPLDQFFRGTIWEPPRSSTRIRRPPATWWIPSSERQKQVTSSKTRKTRKEAKLGRDIRSSGAAKVKTFSKSIYDFSD